MQYSNHSCNSKRTFSGYIWFSLLFVALPCATHCKGKPEANVLEEKWVTSTSGLNLRESPSLEAKTIITIPKNGKVTILTQQNNSFQVSGVTGHWSQVRYKNITGWAFDGFLGAKRPEFSEIPESYHGEFWEDYNGEKALDPLGGAINITANTFSLTDEGAYLRGKIDSIEFSNDETGISFNVSGLYHSGQAEPNIIEENGSWTIELAPVPDDKLILKCSTENQLPGDLKSHCNKAYSKN